MTIPKHCQRRWDCWDQDGDCQFCETGIWKPGWLQKQIKEAKKDIASWPQWARCYTIRRR